MEDQPSILDLVNKPLAIQSMDARVDQKLSDQDGVVAEDHGWSGIWVVDSVWSIGRLDKILANIAPAIPAAMVKRDWAVQISMLLSSTLNPAAKRDNARSTRITEIRGGVCPRRPQ